uniref:Protein NDR1 n=1 Tax=Anthurium amnicola TaxID=1678845 RepID=A0A1D1XVS2_9ARAE
MSEAGGCCRWCTGFLFTLGLTAFFIWLSYRPVAPRYFIVEFQVPPLANPTAPAAGGGKPTVNFTLEVENKNKNMGICHDDIAVSLSYGNQSRSVTIPGFYQGHHKTAERPMKADAGWVPRLAASRDVAESGKAVFHVRVETGYRYKVMLRKGHHHWVKVGANVDVDVEGKKMARKGIRLTSSSTPLLTGPRWALAVAAASAVLVSAAMVLPPPLMLF